MVKKHIRFFSILLVFFVSLSAGVFAQNYASEDELKKAAADFFEGDDFEKSLPLYSQLVSLYPSDVAYNFRYGVCLLRAEGDKSKSLGYLKFAAGKPEVDNRCFYYYGLALHLNYQFNDAIQYYQKFESRAAAKEKKDFPTVRLIEMCNNGKSLLRDPNDVAVLGKQEIKRSDFFRAYNLEEIGGKIIVKPQQFKSKIDVKLNEYSILHLPDNATVLYYSSYGDGGTSGKDIYRVRKLESGEWGDAENIGAPVNTDFDEDYPFFNSADNQLYFSSKGHNSMGGYDVFRSAFNEATGTWSKPVNMDFAISSADDDILFISDKTNEIAYFASSRYSKNDYISVYKVLISKRPIELSIVKGKFIAEADPNQRKARITVMDGLTDEELGVFTTDPNTGEYTIKLPTNGGQVKLILETTDDAPIHTGKVIIPALNQVAALKQELRLVGEGSAQKLVIKNMFDDANREPIDAELIADFIREKAKLEININEEEANTLIANRRGGEGPELIVKEENSKSNESEGSAQLSDKDLTDNLQKAISKLEKEVTLKEKQGNFISRYTFNRSNEADELFTLNEDILDDMSGNPDEAKRAELETQLLANKKKANPMASEAIAGYGLSGALKNEVKEKKLELRQLKEQQLLLKSKLNSGSRTDADEIYAEAMNKVKVVNSMGTTFEVTPSRLQEQFEQLQSEADKINEYLTDLSQEKADLEAEIIRNREEVENLKGKKKEDMINQINAFELDLEDIGFERISVEEKAMKANKEVAMMKSELEMTKALLDKIASNTKDLSPLTPEELLKLENNVNYFKEQNLLEDILGAEQTTSLALNQEIKGRGFSGYQPPYKESGQAVDYDAIYQAELDAAEQLKDEDERKQAKSEIYENWKRSVQEDINQKKLILASTDDAKLTKSIEAEIKALEEVKKEKQSEIRELATTENTKQGYPETETSKRILDPLVAVESNQPLSVLDENGQKFDYDDAYELQLERYRNALKDEDFKEKELAVNSLWAASISNDIEMRQRQLESEKDPETRQEILSAIRDLEKKRADKEELVLLAESASQANNQMAPNEDNKNTNTDNTRANTEKESAYTTLSTDPEKIQNDNGEIIDYSTTYQSAYNEALKTGEKEQADQIIEEWKLSSKAEIAFFREELKRLQSAAEKRTASMDLAAVESARNDLVDSKTPEQEFATISALLAQFKALGKDPAAIELEGEVIDYEGYYDIQLEIAGEMDDPDFIDIIEAARVASRERHISLLKTQAEQEKNKKAREELYALISELEKLNATTVLEVASIEENQNTANTEPENSAFIPVVDEEGEAVDYKTLYAAQLAEAYKQVKDEYALKLLEEEINSNLMKSVEMDLDRKRTERDASRKKKEQRELDEMIAELEAYYKDRQKIDKELSGEIATMAPEAKKKQQSALFANENLKIKYALPDYQSEASNQSLNNAGLLIQDVIEIRSKIRENQAALDKEENTFERERLLTEISNLNKEANQKQVELAKIVEEANQIEFASLNQEAAAVSTSTEALSKQKADALMEESKTKFQEAGRLRKQALTTADFEEKASLLNKAFELEAEALRIQKEALVIYQENTKALAVVDKEEEPDNATLKGNKPKESADASTTINPAVDQSDGQALIISKKEVDAIESNTLFREFTENKAAANRLTKSAEVEYTKSKDLAKEAEKTIKQSVKKREEAERAKKRKDREVALAEALRLEALAVNYQRKSDSLALSAEEKENDARAKDADALMKLQEVGNEKEYERMLSYYEAKQAERLEVRDEVSSFSSEEPGNSQVQGAREVEQLPLAAEITAEEFRKLDFKAIQARVEKDLFIKSASTNVSAYNASKPIPIDEEVKQPGGIVFKVQIGAFRNPIPQDLFKGFAPVNGERTASGITRYTAGIFTTFVTADEAKRQIRNLGYSDAFVVAFRDGKRIPIAEALAALGDLAGVNRNTGNQQNTTIAERPAVPVTNTPNPRTNQAVANPDITNQAPDVSSTMGLFYTVQVGVYANTKIPAQLESIRPLNSERTGRNYVRYTSGRFASFEDAVEWRKQMVGQGVSDAFVTAYLNGNRISVGEARNYQP